MPSQFERQRSDQLQHVPVAATAVVEPEVDDPIIVEDRVFPEEVPVLLGELAVLPPVVLAPEHAAADGRVTLTLQSSVVSKLLKISQEVPAGNKHNEERNPRVTDLLSGFDGIWQTLIIHFASRPCRRNTLSCSACEHLFLTQQEMPVIQSLSEQIH